MIRCFHDGNVKLLVGAVNLGEADFGRILNRTKSLPEALLRRHPDEGRKTSKVVILPKLRQQQQLSYYYGNLLPICDLGSELRDPDPALHFTSLRPGSYGPRIGYGGARACKQNNKETGAQQQNNHGCPIIQ